MKARAAALRGSVAPRRSLRGRRALGHAVDFAGQRGPGGSGSRSPPFSSPLLASARVTASVGAGLALQAARRRQSGGATATAVAEAPSAEDLAEAYRNLRKESPIVERYLDTALDPWPDDYVSMQPLTDEGSASSASIDTLNEYLETGGVRELEYVKQQLGGRWLVLAALDIQGAGFICGVGLAESVEVGEQLAAQQALDRLVLPAEKDQVAYVKRCADAVRGHEHHDEAREPATQAAEALDGLAGRLRDVQVASFCPCGKAWMASISARVFHGTLVLASSADWKEEVAMALAGEVFISRLRWSLRVPPDEPHAPEEWARTWQQRAAAKDPWGGVHRRVSGEALTLPQLGGPTGQRDLAELLGDEDGRYERNAALQAAIRLRSGQTFTRGSAAAWRTPPEEEQEEDFFDGEPGAKERKVPARPPAEPRPYEVTPTDDDPRRPELVGRLPVEQLREPLGEALEGDQVVVVSGGTGSGKSTQLPQFILDDWRGEGVEPQRVVVTQPRRIAAISVAERVAWERRQQIGEGVGYSVHGSSVRPRSPEGSIEFVTVGTLLRRAVSDPLLHSVDTIVVDEVHERDLLTDFLLILLREVLPRRPELRLVLMSATIDVETFTGYFGGCPVLEVPAGPLHPVEEVHLDQGYFEGFDQSKALLSAELDDRTAEFEAGSEAVPGSRWGGDAADAPLIELLEAVVRKEVPSVLKEPEQSSILCFLPGWAEIRDLSERLQQGKDKSKMWVLPLHSTLPKEEQQKVFTHAPKGKVKVILGTNIAESSVTIDDVAVVVDSGLQRELTYDARKRMSSLGTARVSRSSAVQRRGRAGRVRAGKVLRLYSQEQMDRAPARSAPEMQRCDLAQSCLQAAALGRDPRGFLAEAPDPPKAEAVEAAMEELFAVDALEEGEPPRLLPVGEVLARLPLEPQLGRAAMLGSMLGMPGPTAALLAVSGGKSPFVQAQNKREELRAKMREFCDWSDAFAAARALAAWESLRETKTDRDAAAWAQKNMLSPQRLNVFSRDKAQLLRDMRRAGLFANRVLGKSAKGKEAGDLALMDLDDGSSALLENWEEMQGVMDLDGTSSAEGLASEESEQELEGSAEALLTSVLCLAYPSNVARRLKMTSPTCKTKEVRSARISPGSVNGLLPQDIGRGGGEDGGKSWWLYGEMQSVKDKSYLQATTRIQDWHVAVFGGLKVKDIVNQTDPVVELDGWVAVKGSDPESTGVLRSVRRELQDALSWQALAALRGGTGSPAGYLERGSTVVRSALSILAGGELDPSSLELVKEWVAPALEDMAVQPKARDDDEVGEVERKPSPAAKKRAAPAGKKAKAPAASQRRGAATAASPAADEAEEEPEEAEATTTGAMGREELEAKTMPELKELLRARSLKVGGKKAELVDRLLEASSE